MSAPSISSPRRPTDFYDQQAARYDALHRRWLRYAGGEAQAAVEAAVRAVMAEDMCLLDSGCGTGQFARHLIRDGLCPEQMTLLDPSDAMLDRCADLPVVRVKGCMQALPFGDATFDVVTAIWSLEAVAQVDWALLELGRVTKPGGALIVAFCAQKDPSSLGNRLMRHAIQRRGAGRFLSTRSVIDFMRFRLGFDARLLPCNGPASAILARKARATDGVTD